jgi:cytochrome b
MRGPRVILNYLRGEWPVAPGHNPLGALSVLALIVVMLFQVALGLFAVDVDGIESGPMSLYVSFETGRAAAEWHERVFNLLMGLIVLHVIAIGWYRFVKKEKLLEAMLHGARAYPAVLPPVQSASAGRLVLGVVLATALTWAVSRAFDFF